MARVRADLEAVRVAELYANHPLLKHMPVPRFRLPAVKIDVPVLIRGEDEPDSPPRMVAGEAAEKFLEILGSVLSDNDLLLLDDERESIRRAAVLTIDEHLKLPADISGSVSGAVTDLVKIAITTIRPRLQADSEGEEAERLLASVRTRLRQRVMTAFIRYLASPRRLEAEMITSHVKEAGSAEVLAKVRMEVSEDGIEWATVVGGDGELEERLVDE